jgi:hemoglobin-like flavoprotein
MITPQQIKLVQKTWQTITPVSQKMGEEFYTELFKKAPELKALFKSEPKDQAMKLMFMISYLVHRLDQISELQEEIIKLASRHKGYGTKEEHYKIVGETLMWSLEKTLGTQWTPETEIAWNTTYDVISNLMIGAQRVS